MALITVGDRACGRHLVIAGERPVRRVVIPGSRGEWCGGRMTVRAISCSKS